MDTYRYMFIGTYSEGMIPVYCAGGIQIFSIYGINVYLTKAFREEHTHFGLMLEVSGCILFVTCVTSDIWSSFLLLPIIIIGVFYFFFKKS